jgi:hypothetical protein
VPELAVFARRRDADVSDAPTLAGVEVTEDVDAASYAARATVERLVAEGIRETLHRLARGDRVSVQMQLAMDLDETHRPAVAREHGETTGTEMSAPERMCVRRRRRDRGRTAAVRDPESVNDVLRFDARPHGDAELGELGTDPGKLDGEGALRVVEGGRLV